MSDKTKLTFFTMGSEAFVQPIILALRKDYKVKTFIRGQQKEYYQLYGGTDIAWYEWCDEFAGKMIGESTPSVKNIIRLHSYELFTDMPSKVDWSKVHKAVFVSSTVRDLCLRKFGINPHICEVIGNGVDTDKFYIPENKKYNKKVVYMGYVNYKKGIELLIQAFNEIYENDNEFQFHIAGEHQDERIKLYVEHIANSLPFKITFDGWVKDVPAYLEDKDFVISSSFFESFQYSIAEGMCRGCIPLVHNWPGAKDMYPDEYIYTTMRQLCSIVNDFQNLDEDKKQEKRESVRKYVADNFNFKDKMEQTKKMLESLK